LTSIELKRAGFVEGLYPCLSGDDDGEKFSYIRAGIGWRKILEVASRNGSPPTPSAD
jgi:hypothetical protein